MTTSLTASGAPARRPSRRGELQPELDEQPRQSAIEFIRQFARSYTFEPALGALGSMVAN